MSIAPRDAGIDNAWKGKDKTNSVDAANKSIHTHTHTQCATH